MVIQHQKKRKKIKKKNESDINEIAKERNTLVKQKSAIKKLKHFTNHEKKFSNCLIIILKFYLKLNTKQNVEKDSKY